MSAPRRLPTPAYKARRLQRERDRALARDPITHQILVRGFSFRQEWDRWLAGEVAAPRVLSSAAQSVRRVR